MPGIVPWFAHRGKRDGRRILLQGRGGLSGYPHIGRGVLAQRVVFRGLPSVAFEPHSRYDRGIVTES
jgi:hypothetical protein